MPNIAAEAEPPFSPSWIDRLTGWIDTLPGPAWAFYLLTVAATALLINVVLWIDGSVPFGAAGSIRGIFPPFVFYFLALYHYLARISSKALQTFRPLLDQDETTVARIEHDLAKLPRRLGWWAIPLGFFVLPPYIRGESLAYGDLVPQTAFPYALAIVVAAFTGATLMCLIFRSIRQLRLVHELHTRTAKFNLLNLDPAHAFSALTARTGLGVFAIVVFGYFYEPLTFESVWILLVYLAVALMTILIFIVPVLGMRDRLDEEKKHAIRETGDLLQMTRQRLHERVRTDSQQGIGETKDAIEALIRERDFLEKIPTWPWDPMTIRGFASTLLLPIFLWLVTRLLERVL